MTITEPIKLRLTPTEARRLSNRRTRHTVRRDCRTYRCQPADAALRDIESAARKGGR